MNTRQTDHRINILLVDDNPDEYLVLKLTMKKITSPSIRLDYVEDIASAVECIKANHFDIILLDNRLLPNNDFRETAPQVRRAGYSGPIGIVSSDISGSYFSEFRDFGVDFRIGKDEIDRAAIAFIISEYTKDHFSEECSDDYK
jgi:DNA-binding response OmpR family regulator